MFLSRGQTLGLFVTLLVVSSANGQTRYALPGCEPPLELRNALREQLAPKNFQEMKTNERIARRVEIMQRLLEKYPREVSVARDMFWDAWYGDPALFPTLQDNFKKREAASPDDPVAVYSAGYAHIWDDAPLAIQKFKRAHELAPDFAWAHLGLAEVYGRGKMRDLKALSENVAAYFLLCPSSTDVNAHRWLITEGNQERMATVATAIRTRLRSETDPITLQSYEKVWTLEFQVRTPAEHDAVRREVAEDLKRVETAVPAPDPEFQSFLIRGYKLSGAKEELVRTKEDRLLKEFPKSSEALRLSEERWYAAHKEPDDADTAGWEFYNRAEKEALRGRIQQFPDDYHLTHYGWMELIDPDASLPDQEVLRLFESEVKEREESEHSQAVSFVSAAQLLLKHKVRPDLAMETLQRAEKLLQQEKAREDQDTNRGDDAVADSDLRFDLQSRFIVGEMIVAARQLKRPELVERLRAGIGTPPKPDLPTWLYWNNRARLAVLDGHKADALAYYQLATRGSLVAPRMFRGKLRDDYGDEATAFFKEMGGTDEAWATWRAQQVTNQQTADNGFWAKPNKELPEFALVDLAGKTWHLKDLAGKTTLINVWATWCGPCQAELPHIQKLYEMTKDRDDIRVVTFNLDENPGLVQPFLKQHTYRFPVLIAHSFLRGQLAVNGIPQNWIVDSRGKLSTEIVFTHENDWEEDAIRKLERVHNDTAEGVTAKQ